MSDAKLTAMYYKLRREGFSSSEIVSVFPDLSADAYDEAKARQVFIVCIGAILCVGYLILR